MRGGIGGHLVMFFGVMGWRCTNRAKYIGDTKVRGSIHGEGYSFRIFDIWRGATWIRKILSLFSIHKQNGDLR
jgi:hypothetical protein